MKKLELSGQAKIDFEKWYGLLTYHYPILETNLETNIVGLYDLPNSMQWGVYQDWFDSVEICIEFFEFSQGFNFFANGSSYKVYYKTRSEARFKAIEKANVIYNKR